MQADILDRCPDNRQAIGLRREHINLIGALAHITNQTFDGIGRLNGSVHGRRELVKRQQVLFILSQTMQALAVCRREGKPPFFLPPLGRVVGIRSLPTPHLVAEMGLTINALPHTFVLSDKLLERKLVSASWSPRIVWDDRKDLCSVAVDDAQGGELAVAHLLEQGHERLGFVHGPLIHRRNQSC